MSGRTPTDLDAALRSLASTLDVSPAPDYASRVLQRLQDAPSGAHGRGVRPRTGRIAKLLLAAAVLLLAAAATTVAIPASRHVLTSWLGFSGIEIRTAPNSASPPPPGPAPLHAGKPTTLHRARVASKDRLRMPFRLPAPNRVFIDLNNGATVVTLAYRSAPRLGLQATRDTGFALLITEIFDAGEPVLEKIVHTAAHTSLVRISGFTGVFVRGPQEIINLDRTRRTHGMEVVHEVAPRASANTLIWSDSTGTYRLEADMSRPTAVALARGMRR